MPGFEPQRLCAYGLLAAYVLLTYLMYDYQKCQNHCTPSPSRESFDVVSDACCNGWQEFGRASEMQGSLIQRLGSYRKIVHIQVTGRQGSSSMSMS